LKYYVQDVEVSVVAERVQYYDKDGKLITESLKDYTRKKVKEEYRSLDSFLKTWRKAEQKQAVIAELEERGLLLEALAEEVGKDYGPFDLICHVVFDQPPLTRRERANSVRKRNYFTKYKDKARAVLDALLDKFANEGIENIESLDILKVPPINGLGTPLELVQAFGGKDAFLKALAELEAELYEAANGHG
jgi:type I restriction enzyme R subunit